MSVSDVVNEVVTDLFKGFLQYCPIKCKQCQNEIITTTLQRIPPSYVSYLLDETIARTLILNYQFRADITKELTFAALSIKHELNHVCFS